MKFLVMGHIRSGTTLLRKSINIHSEVICYPELLNLNKENRILHHKKYFNCGTWLKDNKSASQYIDNMVYSQNENVGFKASLKQIYYWKLIDYLLQNKIKIIFIYRDLISRYVSNMQSKQIKVWEITNKIDFNKEAITVDFKDFESYYEKMEIYSKYSMPLLENNYLISYRDLVIRYEEVMVDIFNFLNVKKEIKTPDTIKMNYENMNKRVTNWNDFKSYLIHTNRFYLLEDMY